MNLQSVKLYYIKNHSLQPFVAPVSYVITLQKQRNIVMNEF